MIPDAHIDRSSYLSLLSSLRRSHPSATFVTSYDTFHQLNDKSANLTVTDVWARMVASVSGFSPEKVGAVVERWPTPREFWESYKRRRQLAEIEQAEWEEEQRQREKAGGKGKGRKRKRPNPENWVAEELPADYRAIGQVLSKRVWMLWDAERY